MDVEEWRHRKEPAVASGARILDDYDPRWFTKIDTEALSMNDCYECVLGQVFDGYDTGVHLLFGQIVDGSVLRAAIDNGFDVTRQDIQAAGMAFRDAYKVLYDLWMEQIDERKEKAGV